MPTDQPPPRSPAKSPAKQLATDAAPNPAGTGRKLRPAAERALAEAAARRAEHDRQQAERTKEVGGRDGPDALDPTRYGDWEKGGLASDF